MKSLFGCCLAFVIVILVIMGLLVGGAFYVFNMTLGELGLSDQVIVNGMTVAQLGLNDVKLKDIYKLLTSLLEGVDESVIVTHPYTDADVTSLEAKLQNSNIIDPETGHLVFDNLEGGYVTFPDSTPRTFKDTELAALFNKIIVEGMDKTEGEGSSEEVKISIKEVKLTPGTGAKMRTVIKFDIKELREQLVAQVPAQMQSYVNLGDALYIVTESNLTADAEGKIHAGDDHSVSINDIPPSMTDPFMLLLANAMLESKKDIKGIDGQPLEAGPGFFAEMMCGVFGEFIYHFGLVGAAESNLGNSGFTTLEECGAITIVPWTVDTVPADESYQQRVFADIAKSNAHYGYIYARMITDSINEGDITLATNSIDGLIEYFNSHNFPCEKGAEPVKDTTVVNVTFDGLNFTLVSVIRQSGSSICTYSGLINYNVSDVSDYVFEKTTQSTVNQIAADAIAKEVYYAAAATILDIKAGKVTMSLEGNINELISIVNNTFGLNIYGREMPSEEGLAVDVHYNEQDQAFDVLTLKAYVRYGNKTAEYSN